MKVTSEWKGKSITIFIEGSLDTVTAPLLHNEISSLPIESAEEVTLDFDKMHYISSAGLRELLILQKRFKKGALRVRNANANVLDILKMTGFSNLLDVVCAEHGEQDEKFRSFKEFLAEKTTRLKDRTILSDGRTAWTWEDLDKASDLIAEDLLSLGAKRGSHIAICGGNSLNWIATFFAVQKLGGMACLVNPLLSAEEICFLSHAGDIDIFCHGIGPWLMGDAAGFLKAVSDPEKSHIHALYDMMRPLDFKNRSLSPLARNFLDSIVVRSDDPCVMIFTSGSTGVPKGVLLSSYNMLTAASSPNKVFSVREDDVMCLVLPLFHIFGLDATLLYSLMNDIKIVMPAKIKPDSVLDTIEKEHCTFLFSVPTLFLGIAASENFTSERVSSLRNSVIGGAPISEQQMLYLKKQFPQTTFFIVYGLSEMSPISFTKGGDTVEQLTKTVGAPSEFVRVRIENVETKEECPLGETGEILARGVFLMSGYYKTPIEKQDFDSKGWFHTGDLGYLDADGYLHFAGRKKELIIRGGENIFPGEIADVAVTYPGVLGAQVLGIPDEYFGEIVACALTLRSDASFNEEEFKAYLKTRLAPHKIPAVISVFESFPLLANGKVDVLTLKKIMSARAAK